MATDSRMLVGSIDLAKINEAVAFAGKNGAKYINITMFLNEAPDQYGNIGSIKQSIKNADGTYGGGYIGNFKDLKMQGGGVSGQQQQQAQAPQPVTAQQMQQQQEEEDLPF